MKPKKHMDTLMKLGAALEKNAGRSLIVRSTNILGYALFREYGLQILPDESHEIDTGGHCLLVLTTRADVMSGLALRIKEAVQADVPQSVTAQYYVKLSALLKTKRESKEPGWEGGAMKDAVSLALSHFSQIPNRDQKSDSRNKTDPFTGLPIEALEEPQTEEFGEWLDEHPMAYFELSRRSLRRPIQLRDIKRTDETINATAIIICGVAGTVAGKLWLPLVDRTTKITPRLIRRIVNRLVLLKYNPSYAQAVMQEMLARSKPRNRR